MSTRVRVRSIGVQQTYHIISYIAILVVVLEISIHNPKYVSVSGVPGSFED